MVMSQVNVMLTLVMFTGDITIFAHFQQYEDHYSKSFGKFFRERMLVVFPDHTHYFWSKCVLVFTLFAQICLNAVIMQSLWYQFEKS